MPLDFLIVGKGSTEQRTYGKGVTSTPQKSSRKEFILKRRRQYLQNGTFLGMVRLTKRRPLSKELKRFKYAITKATKFDGTKVSSGSQRLPIHTIQTMLRFATWDFESGRQSDIGVLHIEQPIASLLFEGRQGSLTYSKLVVDARFCDLCDEVRLAPFWIGTRFKKHLESAKHLNMVEQNGGPDLSTEIAVTNESEIYFDESESSSDEDDPENKTPSEWPCSRCSFLNPSIRRSCLMCENSLQKMTTWEWEMCTLTNDSIRDSCQVCGHPAPSSFALVLRNEALDSLDDGYMINDGAVSELLDELLSVYPEVSHLPPQLLQEILLKNDVNEPRKSYIIRSLNAIGDLNSKKFLVFPICLEEICAHWCAVVVRIHSREIIHLDSSFVSCPSASRLIPSLRAALRCLFPTHLGSKQKWDRTNPKVNRQVGDVDCGVFLIDNVLTAVTDKSFENGITQDDVQSKRREYIRLLKQKKISNPYRMK